MNSIIWYEIAKATYEVNNSTKFFGKTYESNASIKSDIEFILRQRKPGGYRKPTIIQRQLNTIDKKDYDAWFRQICDILGASAKNHTVATSYALGTLYEIRLGFNQSLYSRNALYQ